MRTHTHTHTHTHIHTHAQLHNKIKDVAAGKVLKDEGSAPQTLTKSASGRQALLSMGTMARSSGIQGLVAAQNQVRSMRMCVCVSVCVCGMWVWVWFGCTYICVYVYVYM